MVTASSAAEEESGFTFVSGDIVLDFAGTLRYRRTRREELLRGPQDVARWLRLADVLDHEPDVAEADFASAISLREAVYELAEAKLAGRALPAGPLSSLNERARGARVTLRLTGSGEAHRDGGAQEALGTMALRAIRLLGSDATLRQCGADGCTRLFIDRSPRRDRRWCAMAGCGNRDKVRAHRRRRAVHSGAL